MIPKAGDIVDINPLFKEAYKKAYCSGQVVYGEHEDGHIHVYEIAIDSKGDFYIKIGFGLEYVVNKIGRPIMFPEVKNHGFPSDAPLFVPVIEEEKHIVLDLKSLNTQPDAIVCARCNGQLKDPGMGPRFKYCPKCEP